MTKLDAHILAHPEHIIITQRCAAVSPYTKNVRCSLPCNHDGWHMSLDKGYTTTW